MFRFADGRLRRRVPTLVASFLAVTLTVGVPVATATPDPGTGGSSDQQRRVNEIIAELDRIGDQIDALGETYSLAVNDMEEIGRAHV